jgi:divalent metal cation (Fe/Co/Zn/Cd) transporter
MTDTTTPLVSLTRYAWLSIGAAVVTISLKSAAYVLTGSVGLLSDALESLVNLAAAIVALLALRMVTRPADAEFTFGYYKVEYFSSGFEGGMILLAAAGIVITALPRLIHPQELEQVGIGLAISVVASLINLGVALIIALLVAANILFTGYRLLVRSGRGLLDVALPPEDLEKVKAIVKEHEAEGVGYHALRSRQAAARKFLVIHLLVPGRWSVARGHRVAEQIENEVRATLPGANIATHIEPAEDPISMQDGMIS